MVTQRQLSRGAASARRTVVSGDGRFGAEGWVPMAERVAVGWGHGYPEDGDPWPEEESRQVIDAISAAEPHSDDAQSGLVPWGGSRMIERRLSDAGVRWAAAHRSGSIMVERLRALGPVLADEPEPARGRYLAAWRMVIEAAVLAPAAPLARSPRHRMTTVGGTAAAIDLRGRSASRPGPPRRVQAVAVLAVLAMLAVGGVTAIIGSLVATDHPRPTPRAGRPESSVLPAPALAVASPIPTPPLTPSTPTSVRTSGYDTRSPSAVMSALPAADGGYASVRPVVGPVGGVPLPAPVIQTPAAAAPTAPGPDPASAPPPSTSSGLSTPPVSGAGSMLPAVIDSAVADVSALLGSILPRG